ncbi:MAG: rod shape-determining protein MreC [Ignavibacteria bacterium]|nr:rod shape-determining protein MreC [Ignavibacteria bacterium]
MRKLGLFLLQIKEYLILSFLLVICLFLIFSNDNSQIRFFRAVAITTLGTFQSGISVIPNVFEIENENKFLREANIRLSVELATLKEIKNENQRLRKMLNFKTGFPYSLISARIVNKSLVQSRNTMTINVGESDGVKIGMPVITDDGLVGRVISTSNGYSIVQILLNKDLKISVKDQRSRIDGILNYDGASNLTVMNIRKNADVNEGDIFITSDYSSNFPSGIPVGIVSESGNLDNLFKKIILTPLVNFEIIEEVFVLQVLPDKEKLELEKYFNKK